MRIWNHSPLFESLCYCLTQDDFYSVPLLDVVASTVFSSSPFAWADVGDVELVKMRAERNVAGSGRLLLWYDCCRSSQSMPRVEVSA